MKACEVKEWTADVYQSLAIRTLPNPDDNIKSAIHGLLGLISEIAEYQDAVTELESSNIVSGYDEKFTHVKKELGDMWWMVAEIAYANNFSLSYVLDHFMVEICGDEGYIVGLREPAEKLAEQYQKFFQGHDINPDVVLESLASLANTLTILSYYYGGPYAGPEEIWRMNIEKLEARYPDGFDAEKSLNRRDGDV